jgi:hypothetical protein
MQRHKVKQASGEHAKRVAAILAELGVLEKKFQRVWAAN